ncbi:MAG TPA: HK97-gp10 family putative phage morphogenesis protein [Thermomicrobiales bacterium]|nr:HK97-gp10 family putative phage morphogenesis protein [Thermomicrobiales bacterium]
MVSNRLPQVAAKVRPLVSAEVKKAGFDVQAKAQALVPVKTGLLRRSITTQFPTDLSAVVGPSANYGIYVEFGTRHMGARPYMRPAAEAVLPGFAAKVAAALKGL